MLSFALDAYSFSDFCINFNWRPGRETPAAIVESRPELPCPAATPKSPPDYISSVGLQCIFSNFIKKHHPVQRPLHPLHIGKCKPYGSFFIYQPTTLKLL
jgi:hypothetical protein